MLPTLLVATHNTHKTEEIRSILGDLFVEIIDLESVPSPPAPEETGATFAENSEIKALAASQVSPDAWVLADDSGLEVDALGGDPGVYSARYAGDGADDAANRKKLQAQLAALGAKSKPYTARFRCVITIAQGGKTHAQFDGTVEGQIADAEAGSGGFGYDSLFIPEGHECTFAELPSEAKNSMSHRGRALAGVRAWFTVR